MHPPEPIVFRHSQKASTTTLHGDSREEVAKACRGMTPVYLQTVLTVGMRMLLSSRVSALVYRRRNASRYSLLLPGTTGYGYIYDVITGRSLHGVPSCLY